MLVYFCRFPHKIKGEGICCYVVLNQNENSSDELYKELKIQVRKEIGAFASPDLIVFIPGLPKVKISYCVNDGFCVNLYAHTM